MKDRKIKFYMNGKEIGVCTSSHILPTDNKPDKGTIRFKQNVSVSFKSDKQIEFCLDRPSRIKKYIKQILRQ